MERVKKIIEALEAVETPDISTIKDSIVTHSEDISNIKRDCEVLKAHLESCTRLINDQDEIIEEPSDA